MPLYISILLLLLLGAPPDDDSVWVEGESASVKQVRGNAWYSDSVRKEEMSGGAWLSHFSEASDGTDALRQLETTRADVLITDMHMPEMDGLALARALRKRPDAPALIGMSGNDYAETLEMATRLGARATLHKPFTSSQLLHAVGKALPAPDPGPS